MDISRFVTYKNKVVENCSKIIVGKEEAISLVPTCFVCQGHVLLEDIPGTVKAMLLRAFARTIGGDMTREQEMSVLCRPSTVSIIDSLKQVVFLKETAYVCNTYTNVTVSEPVLNYLMDIIERT